VHVYERRCFSLRTHQDSLDMNLSLQIDDLSIVVNEDKHQMNLKALHVSVLKHLEASCRAKA